MASKYFFTGHTFFTTLLTGLFYMSLSDPQDAESDSDASNTDCDIDNASELKTKLNGWQYFIHDKFVSNLYGVSLSLKSPLFLSVLEVQSNWATYKGTNEINYLDKIIFREKKVCYFANFH